MPKQKFSQTRTLDFELTNILRVDIDSLGIDLDSLSERQVRAYVEDAWMRFLSGEESYCGLFNPIAIKSNIIPNSLTADSKEMEMLDEEEQEEE